MADVTTPLADGTVVGLLVGDRLLSFNLLNDTAGADAMGLVSSTPAANTLLGRLKAVADALGGELTTALPSDAATATGVAAVKASVDALAPYLDGLEALLGALGTEATLAALSGKLPVSTGPKAQSGSLSVVPATGTDLATNAAVTGALQSVAPADDVFTVVPSDTTDLPTIPKGLRAKTAGTLALRGASGSTVDYGTVTAGEMIYVRARRVMATGTTATLVAFV